MSLARRSEATATYPAAPLVARRPWRLWYYVFAGLFGLALVSGATPPTSSPATATPPGPRPMGAVAAPANAASPLDEPLRLVAGAQEAYKGVRDYTCLLVKREVVGGRTGPDNIIVMKVRAEPFSVSLRWVEPRNLRGQEACYVAGRNNGQMRVRPAGWRSVAGFVPIDPNDPRARESSRHSITEAGIGNIIKRHAEGWQAERTWNLTRVSMAEYEYNRRRCVRVETTHPADAQGRFSNYRNVVYFDKEHHLPVRVESYDWPRYPGDPGQLLEVYSFANLRLNVGLGEEEFNK